MTSQRAAVFSAVAFVSAAVTLVCCLVLRPFSPLCVGR